MQDENLEQFTLLEERLKVKDIKRDPKLSKVWRIKAQDEYSKYTLELDINFQLFSIKVDESLLLLLTKSMGNNDEDNGIYDPQEADRKNPKFDKYEYVMSGKIFKIGESGSTDITTSPLYSVYASFGGLLMKITAKKDDISNFTDDTRVFLLIAKA